MGLVNNSILRVRKLRREYVQAAGASLFLVGFSLGFGPTPQFFSTSGGKPEVRLAYFPNLTHAPALIGVEDHTFAASLPQYTFSTKVVNAGPEAMEAMLAGAIDAAYVGPSPALNTFVKSHGKALRILAGVCEGGAALVCRGDLALHSVADLAGRRVAVPEFGGTQDVSLRHFLKQSGLAAQELGGTVEILPIKNPEILALFKRKEIDAAWVPEPWASRLVVDTGAHVVAAETDLWPTHKFATTVLVASSNFIVAHPDAAAALVADNARIIDWIGSHSDDAKSLSNRAIGKLTGKPLKKAIVDMAWPHLAFSSEQDRPSLQAFAMAAHDAGYLKGSGTSPAGIWLNPDSHEILAVASK